MSKEDTDAIQEAETTLTTDLKIDPSVFDEALQQLEKRKTALDNIERGRQDQFFPDAFQLVSTLNVTKEADRVAIVAKYLRRFALYVVQSSVEGIKAGQDAVSIVDNIGAMGTEKGG